MTSHRGDVVLLDYPFSDNTGSKVRPALVVQNDRDNLHLIHTIGHLDDSLIRQVDQSLKAALDLS